MRSGILSAALLLMTACATTQHADPSLRGEFEAMLDSDQSIRGKLNEIEKKNGKDSPEMKAAWQKQETIDEANIARLEEVIKAHGWPGRSIVGEKGSEAAFLVLQHADYPYQNKYLPVFRKAVAAGEARRESLALLEDRVLMREGKKQIYGSQLQRGANGAWEFYPIEDEINVDKRRQSVGLESMAEYAKFFGIEYHPK